LNKPPHRKNNYAIVIPTILPQRKKYLGELLTQLAHLCPYAPIVVSAHIQGLPPKTDLVRALKRGAAFGLPWVIYLEDDAYLATVFPDEVARILVEASHQDFKVATFYSNAERTLKAMRQGKRSCIIQPRYFWASVCLAIHSEEIPQIAAFAPAWYEDHPEHWHASDLLIAAYCAATHKNILCCVPSPVQHRDPPSTLGHCVRSRRYSRTFRYAYGTIPD
jgi:hypothetical protein